MRRQSPGWPSSRTICGRCATTCPAPSRQPPAPPTMPTSRGKAGQGGAHRRADQVSLFARYRSPGRPPPGGSFLAAPPCPARRADDLRRCLPLPHGGRVCATVAGRPASLAKATFGNRAGRNRSRRSVSSSTRKSTSLVRRSKSALLAAEPNTSNRRTPKRRHSSARSFCLAARSGCMGRSASLGSWR